MSTKHLTGDRAELVSDFRAGKFLGLVNSGILVAGFDAPNIGAVVWNTGTMSWSRYIQGTVRGSRPFEGKKDFKVLDFGGNVARHGTYEEEKKFSLWHTVQDGCGVAPTKICPTDKNDNDGKTGCGRMILSTYQVCPFDDCGYIFATEKELRTIELNEVIGGTLKFSEMDANQLVAYAELHGYNKTWAFRQMYIGGGSAGFKKGMKALGYNWSYIYRQLEIYEKKKK